MNAHAASLTERCVCGAGTRHSHLWSTSTLAALMIHIGGALAVASFGYEAVNDMPAGAFSLELAAFGGATQAAAGGGAKAAPAPPPQPQVAEKIPTPPVPQKAEVALPKPKPKPVPKDKSKPVAKAQIVEKKTEAQPAPSAVPQMASTQSQSQGVSASISGAPGAGGGVVTGRLGGGGTTAGTPLGRYKVLVFQALWNKRRYPAVAQRMGYQGEVEIEFSIASSGEILSSRVLSSSGFGVLDRETKSLLHRVRKFPPFPSDLRDPSLTFRVTIPFELT